MKKLLSLLLALLCCLTPCAALADAETGRISIYYGGADTVICMAHCMVDEVVDFIKNNSL